jgi:hypothetical protein
VSDPKFVSDMSIPANKASVARCVEVSVPKTSGMRNVRSNRVVKGVVKEPDQMLKKVCV